MGRAELNLHVLSQSRRKSFFQGREFCLSAHTVIAPRTRCGRVTPVGRTRLGRGAVEPRARGDDNQGGKNDFLRFQEQLLRRKKQKLFLGVSVGNGVRGGITLHKIGVRITIQKALNKNNQNRLSVWPNGSPYPIKPQPKSLSTFVCYLIR